jgi:hypothetical protein
MKPPKQSVTNNAKVTEPQYDGPADAREQDGAGKYPNYHEFKSRSGHVMVYDDSDGHESITLQHRTGSMIQMMPDGMVQIVSHNGQYNIVFGENRLMVTGAHDLTVKGTASMMVEGDYNTTVRGLMSLDVEGSLNISAKDFNQVIRGNLDVQAKNMTMKVEGNASITTQGNFMIAGYGDMSLGSLAGSMAIGASGTVGIRSVRDEVAIQGQGDVSVKSDGGKILQESSSDISMKSGGAYFLGTAGMISMQGGGTLAADAPEIQLNSGQSVAAEGAKAAGSITQSKPGSKTAPQTEVKATKAATILT